MKQVSPVFWITIFASILFVLWGAIFPENLKDVMNVMQAFFLTNFGWYYQLTATLLLGFALFLVFSPYGKIKLGKDDEKPEFNRITWFAMLFSAGMGIGLLFFGVSEPISHYLNPPMGPGATEEAARLAMRYTFLHWGLHAWGIYAVIALAIAYFKFRKGTSGLISATLTPILGDRTNGLLGKIVDIIAVFATIFGVAASLGLGAEQINGGLSYLTDLPNDFNVQLVIIIIVTVLFMISALTGVKRGIKYLSNINMGLAVVLLLVLFAIGPTVFLLNLYTTSFGDYIQNIIVMGTSLAPFNEENASWLQDWTIFYWAWWIAWSPFVGTFIARVSRGRTVREFLITVLIVPTIVCSIWFTVFGGTAIFIEHNLGVQISGQSLETAMFYMYEHLPLTLLLVIVSLILISVFFITSADSATFVLSMQTTYGSLKPPNMVKIVWGFILSASAAVLLYSGGLEGFQTAIIVSAFPLSIILFMMMFSLLKSFRAEAKTNKK